MNCPWLFTLDNRNNKSQKEISTIVGYSNIHSFYKHSQERDIDKSQSSPSVFWCENRPLLGENIN